MSADRFPQTTKPAGRVLVCAAGATSRFELSAELARIGFDVLHATTPDDILKCLADSTPDVCLLADADDTGFAGELSAHSDAAGSVTWFVSLVKQGSGIDRNVLSLSRSDYLEVPYESAVLRTVIASAVERSRLLAENRRLRRNLAHRALSALVGQSAAMQRVREQVQQAAADDGPVLIQGEPGTGLGLIAHGIHSSGRRAYRPFLRYDCRVLSSERLDRELFSREAVHHAAGPAGEPIAADGATLFLNDVESMALPLQKKLVRFLDEQRQRREQAPLCGLGEVRFLAATHANVEDRIRSGLLRDDLHHALKPIRITAPRLCQHKEDIGLLTEHFLNELVAREGKSARRVTFDALRSLEDYDWPGNVRELQNVIERACSLNFGDKLTAEMIQPWLSTGTVGEDGGPPGMSLKDMERKLIETTFARCGGNRERTARNLQIGLRTLSGKLREYGYPPHGGPGSNLKVAPPKAA